jgi:hypothetical protein
MGADVILFDCRRIDEAAGHDAGAGKHLTASNLERPDPRA